jgi:hypothetical protein
VYFNPSDVDHPIAFNILENVGDEYKNLVSNGLVGVFKKIWADSWGPRLEYILINAILALLEYPGSTLLGVTRMLVDAKYRKKVVGNITDPVVKSFWVDEYNNYTEKFRSEAIAPIQNKVGQFLSSSLIRNIVGQSKSTIDMRQLMDDGKIVLMNLSKGRIGEENAALLGAMMITKIQLAAMSRVDIPEPTRRDFYLYVDEFQNFSTESFANILSEARKYRLNLIMAHQYIEQLSDEVKAAVFGNVGTLIAFRVGGVDAEELEKEFQPTFMQEDVVTLPAFHVYMRLMIDGVASEPFSASTLPPISGQTDQREKVIQVSRERYSRDRGGVEEKIMKWAGYAHGEGSEDDDDEDGGGSAAPRPSREPRRDARPAPLSGPAKRTDDRRPPSREQGRSGSPAAQKDRPVAPKPAPKRQESVPKPVTAAPAPVSVPQRELPVPQPSAAQRVVAAVREPVPPPPQPVRHELEDLRTKKLSFVQESPAQQPAPQTATAEQHQTVEFHSLAEALPAIPATQPAPQQPPATRVSQTPRAPQASRPPQSQPQQSRQQQTTQQPRSPQTRPPQAQTQSPDSDSMGKRKRRRRRKKSGDGDQQQGHVQQSVLQQQRPQPLQQPQAPQHTAKPQAPQQPQVPQQPHPVAHPSSQPLQPGQPIRFD